MRSSSSAICPGATQMPVLLTTRILLVSGGPLSASDRRPPRTPAAATNDVIARKRRRILSDLHQRLLVARPGRRVSRVAPASTLGLVDIAAATFNFHAVSLPHVIFRATQAERCHPSHPYGLKRPKSPKKRAEMARIAGEIQSTRTVARCGVRWVTPCRVRTTRTASARTPSPRSLSAPVRPSFRQLREYSDRRLIATRRSSVTH
jgi:hypothetical protein